MTKMAHPRLTPGFSIATPSLIWRCQKGQHKFRAGSVPRGIAFAGRRQGHRGGPFRVFLHENKSARDCDAACSGGSVRTLPPDFTPPRALPRMPPNDRSSEVERTQIVEMVGTAESTRHRIVIDLPTERRILLAVVGTLDAPIEAAVGLAWPGKNTAKRAKSIRPPADATTGCPGGAPGLATI